MNALYPPLAPYAIHALDVGAGHRLYVEECGEPAGVPVVFLHGGPGSGCGPEHRRYFDPGYYRILLVDQRGSGRSTPVGGTAANTTRDLVLDLELIRAALGIERWLLFGGSWGATLALVYAQTHPAAVLGLVLRGTFLARARDLDWFFGPGGVARLLPGPWRVFQEGVPPAARADLIAGYYAAVHGADPGLAATAALAWSAWADQVSSWGRAAAPAAGAAAGPVLSKVRIETHYARHGYFLEDNEILRRAGRLPAVPLIIVHGLRDLVCPLEGAWALHQAVPGSRLVVVEETGHLIAEPGMIDALVGETDRLRSVFG